MNRFSAPSCVFCPSSIEFVSVCLLCLCVFSKISSIGRASPCCLPFPLFFPHFSSLYIYIFQLFRWALPMFPQIFFFCVFARSHLTLCLSSFRRSVQGGEKVGKKVEKRWRASPSCLTFPPPDTFPHPRGFPTPANSGKTKDF